MLYYSDMHVSMLKFSHDVVHESDLWNYSCDLNFRVECSLNNAIKTLKKHPVAIPLSLIKKCMTVNIDAIAAIF